MEKNNPTKYIYIIAMNQYSLSSIKALSVIYIEWYQICRYFVIYNAWLEKRYFLISN